MDEITKLIKGELIGKQVTLTNIHDQSSVVGKIVDETKSTVIVRTKEKNRRLIKASHVFSFSLGTKTANIQGILLCKRPEERIKTKMMRRW